jgi:hypothetical protein
MSSTTGEGTGSDSGAEQVKERVQDAAAKAKGRTREQLRSQIDERSTMVGEQMSSAASAMRGTSDRLRLEGNERAASVIDAVADRGQTFGDYLKRADGDRLLRDVEDVARRQPWLMVAGSAVVGFLASRFMKASSTSRYRASGGQLETYPTPMGVARPPASSPTGAYAAGAPVGVTGTGGGTGGLG